MPAPGPQVLYLQCIEQKPSTLAESHDPIRPAQVI